MFRCIVAAVAVNNFPSFVIHFARRRAYIVIRAPTAAAAAVVRWVTTFLSADERT